MSKFLMETFNLKLNDDELGIIEDALMAFQFGESPRRKYSDKEVNKLVKKLYSEAWN